MKTKLLSLIAALLILCPAMAAPPKDGTNWKQTFSDDFNGTKLDATKWSSGYPWGHGPNAANGELQGYSPNAITVANGFLNITSTNKAINVDGYNYKYTSGLITTNGKFSQNGGYLEARIKFPKGNGLWGAFWTLPPAGKWPPEVDMVEFIGNDNDNDTLTDYQIAHLNRHYACSSASGGCNDGTAYDSGIDLTKDYHIYGAYIQPDKNKIDYYLDDQKVATITGNAPNELMYMILNLADGGSWPGNPDKTTKFPAVMSVDYVRAYVNNGSIPTTPTDPTTPTPQPTTFPVTCAGTAQNSGTFTLNCTSGK